MNKAKFLTPKEAEDAFYLAIENADLKSMMSIWSDNDATVCIHPGAPRLEGRDEIRQSWQEIFEASPSMAFSISDERITQDDRLAVHLVKEEIVIEGEIVSIMLTTNIYHLIDGGWRMMLHHSSPEPDPFLDDMALADDEPIVLH
ncbi:MAG: nuclear transport factor 2 family protein [Pseudomonadota bacterium]